jgi:hypothetical protein
MSENIKNTERSQINDLMLHLKLLDKQEQAKPKISRRWEITKIKGETETKKKKKKPKEWRKQKAGSLKR